MEQVTLKEVQSAIKDLNSYSDPGIDRIDTLLIKIGGDYLHKTITIILNATCQLGYFPDTCKRDNRIYFKKSGNDSYHNPNSYRSISLSNIFGITLEKVLLRRLLLTLEGSNFFHGKNICAYIKFYNTSHAIIPMIGTKCEALSMGHYGAAVMADPEGAFDATWRKGLIYKIYKVSVKGMLLTILDSFLKNRFSRNLVNCYISELFETSSGVHTQSSTISSLYW